MIEAFARLRASRGYISYVRALALLRSSLATSQRPRHGRIRNDAVRWASWPRCQEVNEENSNERGSPGRHELWRDRSGSRAERLE
jgi:hypothetical protein